MWEALGAGICPDLYELHLRHAHLDSNSAAALDSALASGSLNKLKHVNLKGTHWDDGGDDDERSVADANFVAVLDVLASFCHG